jgi:hypothetical protein
MEVVDLTSLTLNSSGYVLNVVHKKRKFVRYKPTSKTQTKLTFFNKLGTQSPKKVLATVKQ